MADRKVLKRHRLPGSKWKSPADADYVASPKPRSQSKPTDWEGVAEKLGATSKAGFQLGCSLVAVAFFLLMFKWLDRIACWMFGHVFPVTWVSPGGAAHDWGTCQRCGRFQIADYEADQCRDCGNTIAAGDDDALICVQCGGRNRRASVSDALGRPARA